MRRLLLSILTIILLSSAVSAQQDPQYSMYMFNRYVVNPAYAGSLEATNVTLLGRSQWVGIKGAPKTTTASINAKIDALHGGVGAYIIGDQVGPISTFGLKGAYSFHLDMGSAKLNIGVGGGLYQKSLDNTWIYPQDNGPDPVLQASGKTQDLSGDIDAGIYFHIPLKSVKTSAYPQDKFYLGLSASHLLEPKINDLLQSTVDNSVLSRNLVATAGYTIPLSSTVYLQPSANFRMVGKDNPLTDMQLDLNANLYISPMVFGISHRGMITGGNNDSWAGIIGFNASSYLFMGYSYDYTTSQLSGFTTGSHELVLSYTFPSKVKRIAPIDGVRKPGGRI
jgi:type IX secretion system PorP/SprF family membrane protein